MSAVVTLKYSIMAATYWPHELTGMDVLAYVGTCHHQIRADCSSFFSDDGCGC